MNNVDETRLIASISPIQLQQSDEIGTGLSLSEAGSTVAIILSIAILLKALAALVKACQG